MTEETNHPYDAICQLFWPVVCTFLGIAIGGGLVLIYLTH